MFSHMIHRHHSNFRSHWKGKPNDAYVHCWKAQIILLFIWHSCYVFRFVFSCPSQCLSTEHFAPKNRCETRMFKLMFLLFSVMSNKTIAIPLMDIDRQFSPIPSWKYNFRKCYMPTPMVCMCVYAFNRLTFIHEQKTSSNICFIKSPCQYMPWSCR